MLDAFAKPQTLIVVSKDELVFNQLKKLIETKDDEESGEIVGTEDGSISVISWNENMWLEQKKAGNISDKILFIGDIKGTDKLYPVLDIKYDKWGIQYGWAGKQAMLVANGHYVSEKEHYNAFLREFNSEELPKKKVDSTLEKNLKYAAVFGITVCSSGIINVGRAKTLVNWFTDKIKVRQQLYLFGIMKLYENHLDEFMKS